MSTLADFMLDWDARKAEHGPVGEINPNAEVAIRRHLAELGLDWDDVNNVAHDLAACAVEAFLTSGRSFEDFYMCLKGMWVDGLLVGRQFVPDQTAAGGTAAGSPPADTAGDGASPYAGAPPAAEQDGS